MAEDHSVPDAAHGDDTAPSPGEKPSCGPARATAESDLAREKTRLEIEKLQRENRKLEQELALLRPEHLRPSTWLSGTTVAIAAIALVAQYFQSTARLDRAMADARAAEAEKKLIEYDKRLLGDELSALSKEHLRLVGLVNGRRKDLEEINAALSEAKTDEILRAGERFQRIIEEIDRETAPKSVLARSSATVDELRTDRPPLPPPTTRSDGRP